MNTREIKTAFERIKARSNSSGANTGELFPVGPHVVGLYWQDSKPAFFIKTDSNSLREFRLLKIDSLFIYKASKDLGKKFGGHITGIFCCLNNIELFDFFIFLIQSVFLEFESKNGDSAKILLNVLKNWKLLLSSQTEKGLTEEEAKGLYGELSFLLEFKINFGWLPITNWQGYKAEPKDFEFKNFSVEVKTSSVGKRIITINGIHQLNNNSPLFLVLYEITEDYEAGNSLENLVNALCENIEDPKLVDILWSGLIKVGYNPRSSSCLTKYSVRQTSFYSVDAKFPNISSSNISNITFNNLKKIKYSLDISMFPALEHPYTSLKVYLDN